MKIFTVTVVPRDDTFKVTYDKTSAYTTMEREDIDTKPNAIGFYHYPQNMADDKALEALLNVMIQRHDEEILKLQKSKEALTKLRRY